MKRIIICLGLVAALSIEANIGFDRWVDDTVLPDMNAAFSAEVLDRDGRLLRAYTVDDGRWRLAVKLRDVDPDFRAMLIRYEDKRFEQHNGVDLIAMARSLGQMITQGRVISGGSTLTMQVARLLEDGSTGRWPGKLRQVRLALALERKFSKDEILTLYLNHAPYGGNIEGIRAASLAYFDRPPKRLTPAQSALLVALPQSPERRRPDRFPANAQQARDRVLERLHQAGVLPDAHYKLAIAQGVDADRFQLPKHASHMADRALGLGATQLTLNKDVQVALEALAAQSVQGRSDDLQIAMVAADWTSGEIVASVGSAAYQAGTDAGFIDLTRAVRSPGSTLKPLVFGLGFEAGLVHPNTLISDRPTNFSGYQPQNFDGRFRGELRVRDALQQSLNIPTVSVTQELGPLHLMAGLRAAGVNPIVPGGRPGLAVSLGGVGVTLADLVHLFAGIANKGQAVDLRWNEVAQSNADQPQIMGKVAAWYVTDILRDTPRPRGFKGVGVAYKTGTSYGHRDAWAIGYDGQHVIGVWMGRADGTAVPGIFGGDLAAPVMFSAFARLKPQITPFDSAPKGAVLYDTADLPKNLQRFGTPLQIETPGPEIAFPPNGAVLEGDAFVAKVRDGQGPYVWLANGAFLAKTHTPFVEVSNLGVGFAALSVIDGNGQSARAQIEIR